MWEYLILIFCFGFVIYMRIFLFKKGFNRKLNFYSDPDDLVPEIIQNINKQSISNPRVKFEYLNVNNQAQIINLNLSKMASLSLFIELYYFIVLILLVKNKDEKGKIERSGIVDCLRKVSLVIALIKDKNKEKKENLVNEMKILSNMIFPVYIKKFN